MEREEFNRASLPDEQPGKEQAASLPPVICVASNDRVWASLLAQNLGARGATTIQCDLRNLKLQIGSIPDGSWIIVDGGWPMLELQSATDELNNLLHKALVSTVMIVDELVGPHPLSAFEPDIVLNRTPDMRVLVRSLLSIFSAASQGQPEPAI